MMALIFGTVPASISRMKTNPGAHPDIRDAAAASA